MDDEEVRSDRSPHATKRLWWRWNLVTLASLLFVLVWVRAWLQFSPSVTWSFAGTIALAWWLMPGFIVGDWPWPVSLTSKLSGSVVHAIDGQELRDLAAVGRVASVLVGVGGVVNAIIELVAFLRGEWVVGAIETELWLVWRVVWWTLQLFGIALALWMLAALCQHRADVVDPPNGGESTGR